MIKFRYAIESDLDLYYQWLNDPEVRKNSFNQQEVSYADHSKWFKKILKNPSAFLYVFHWDRQYPVGQVRIVKGELESIIGISIDAKYRGKGMTVEIIKLACSDFLSKFSDQKIIAFIKPENVASLKVFKSAGFYDCTNHKINEVNSFRLIYTK
jgi:RimJ/RimL family protein N-acetyltransferase